MLFCCEETVNKLGEKTMLQTPTVIFFSLGRSVQNFLGLTAIIIVNFLRSMIEVLMMGIFLLGDDN